MNKQIFNAKSLPFSLSHRPPPGETLPWISGKVYPTVQKSKPNLGQEIPTGVKYEPNPGQGFAPWGTACPESQACFCIPCILMPRMWGRFCNPCKSPNRISGMFLPPLQKSQPNLRHIIPTWVRLALNLRSRWNNSAICCWVSILFHSLLALQAE